MGLVFEEKKEARISQTLKNKKRRTAPQVFPEEQSEIKEGPDTHLFKDEMKPFFVLQDPNNLVSAFFFDFFGYSPFVFYRALRGRPEVNFFCLVSLLEKK